MFQVNVRLVVFLTMAHYSSLATHDMKITITSVEQIAGGIPMRYKHSF